ncbi:MAG: helix-turn-helix domain-containing protein [Caldilinea sp.]|nr:helix-turn-helix domain-containing protein [Caldilinea sp.]MDW8440892.1 helix-turn-helix domain-containing protein [Caldilineaceae bacterium]
MTPTLRVGFGISPGDPFWVQVREAVKQRAESLGLELIPLKTPRIGETGDVHLRFLEELKAREISALISHVLPESFMLAILNNGIPLICSEDTMLRHPKLVSVHGLGRAALMAAEYIVERLQGSGRVLMVGARRDGSLTATLRIQGFRTALQHQPALHCLHVGDGWRYEETVEQLLEESPEWTAQLEGGVDAIFGLSDSLALAGRDVCRKLSLIRPRTVIVGVNGDPLAIAAIQEGEMDATIDTNPRDLGYHLAEFAHRAALGRLLPDHFPYTFELVTSANVSQVAVRKLVFIADLPSRLVDVNRRLEQQRLVQLETSLEINQRIGSILDQHELLTTIGEIIGTRYACDEVHFLLWSNTERVLTRFRPDGVHTEEKVPLAAAGPLAHALLNNQPVYIPDTFNSQRYAPDPQWPDTRSRVVLPVRVGGRTLGVLDLHSRHRVVRTQAELDALQTLADEIGIAMRNAQLYAQALQARAEAVQAGLLRSRLLARVSHQLRTPLNVILGYCQAALASPNPYGAPLPPELRKDLHYIERSGADLQRLINDLLDLAQMETGALRLFWETVDVGQLLTEVFETAVRIFHEQSEVRWRLQVPKELPKIQADPVRLRNMLINLVDNAARFTEEGQIVLGADATETQVHLWVQDSGCGMTPELLAQVNQRKRLYDDLSLPYGSTDHLDHLGLGLVIVQSLTALHNGEFRIESELGRGTICHLFLPRQSQTELSQPPTPVLRVNSLRYRRARISAQLVEKVREFVARNYASPFTREQLAAEIGVTPAYVSRIFRQHTGVSLWEYVTGFRIARARELLEHSDLSITEVAFTVGFNDSAYFSRVFRKETGKSPVDYRAAYERV